MKLQVVNFYLKNFPSYFNRLTQLNRDEVYRIKQLFNNYALNGIESAWFPFKVKSYNLTLKFINIFYTLYEYTCFSNSTHKSYLEVYRKNNRNNNNYFLRNIFLVVKFILCYLTKSYLSTVRSLKNFVK